MININGSGGAAWCGAVWCGREEFNPINISSNRHEMMSLVVLIVALHLTHNYSDAQNVLIVRAVPPAPTTCVKDSIWEKN